MNSSQRTIVGLLVVIAFLLGWIAATSTVGFGRGGAEVLPGLLPAAHAAQVPMNVDRDYFVTSSEDGSRIYVWRLGPMVNDHVERASARTFSAVGQ